MQQYRDATQAKKTEISKKVHDFGAVTKSSPIVRHKVVIGLYTRFEHGAVVSFSHKGSVKTSAMWGGILAKWLELGAASENNPVGLPVTDELSAPDNVGRFNHFTKGSIYWTPKTGAQFVMGAIRGKWSYMHWERGPAGYPKTGELATPAPKDYGRYNHFQNGSIYWSPATGAHYVPSNIFEVWATVGHERGKMGFPVDEDFNGLGKLLVSEEQRAHTVFFEGGFITRHAQGEPTVTFYDEVDPDRLNVSIAPFPIEIVYQGFICVNESDVDQWWGGTSDEPYFMMGAFTDKEHSAPKKFGPYNDVDSGEARRDGQSTSYRTLMRIEKGESLPTIGITVSGYEHDEGDDTLRGPAGKALEEGLKVGGSALAEYLTKGSTKGVAGKIAGEISKKVGKAIFDWGSGKRDDDIDVTTRIFGPSELIKLATIPANVGDRLHVPVNVRIDLRNSDEGDYNVYFYVYKA